MIKARMFLLAIIVALVACSVGGPSNSPLPPPRDMTIPQWRYSVLLPVVVKPLDTPIPQPTPTELPGCRHIGEEAREFVRLLVIDQRQERVNLKCDERLVRAAFARAQKSLETVPISHYDSNGLGPNAYAAFEGCSLPPDYAPKGNNIESLVAGTGDVTGVGAYEALARSESHSKHLFGQGDFFLAQDRIGAAVVRNPNTFYKWSMIILIGRCLD